MKTGTIWLSVFAAAAYASARAGTPLQECQAADPAGVRACLQEQLEEADAALGERYRATRTAMEKLDRTRGRTTASRTFEASQRAFREYRDRTCEWIAAVAGGGNAGSELSRDCRIRLVRERTAQLEEQMREPSETSRESEPIDVVAPALANVEWTLVELEHDGIAQQLVVAAKPTLRVRLDGAAGGFGSVNKYFGNVAAAPDGSFTWTGPLGSTQMAGPPELMEQETTFLDALQRAARWHVEGSTLVLESADGTVRLKFAK